MVALISIIALLVLIAVLIFVTGHVEYEHYIKKLAETKTIEEIEEKINEDNELIDSNSFGGHMLENLLDHKELWEQVRNYKLTNKK